jgi:hypothetical protein
MTMDEVTFDIETQAAAAITNIGGDQTIYAGERRSRLPRIVSVIGLLASLIGLGLLIWTGVDTATTLLEDNDWSSNWEHYKNVVAGTGTWLPAVIFSGAGIVLSRLGRVPGRS